MADDTSATRHLNLRRKDPDAPPYINHPIALADVLWHEGGVRDPVVIAATQRHNTVDGKDINVTIIVPVIYDRFAGSAMRLICSCRR